MRLLLSALALLFASSAVAPDAASAQQTAPGVATYVSLADIQAALGRSPQFAVNPQPNIRVVDAGGFNVAVGAIHRPQSPPGVVAVHFKVTEVYHVIEARRRW